jgi:hypothetical protein
MLRAFFTAIAVLLFCSALFAQSNETPESATISVQESPAATAPPPAPQFLEVKIPAGTALDI